MNYARYMHPLDQICFIMNRIYNQGLTTLTGGNLSVRDSEDVVWLSPTGIDKASLAREDIVCIYPDGHVEGRYKPTSEHRIHTGIYKERPGMKAVLHAHPPALVAMSVMHLTPDPALTFGTLKAFSNVGLAEYAMPGTVNLMECVVDAFKKGHDAAILKNHAAFLGSTIDLFDCFRRFEQMEIAARIQINAWALGEINLVDKALFEQFNSVFSIGKEGDFEVKNYCSAELEMRRSLAALAKRAYKKGLFTGIEGTISGRIPNNAFIISPATRDNAYIAEEDFVHVEDGKFELGKMPDIVYSLHEAIYNKHKNINSIITAAPVSAGAYVICDKHFDVTIIPESYGVLRDAVRLTAKQFLTETETVVSCFNKELPLCVVENFGLLIAGPTPLLAFDKLEVAESTAQSIQMARISSKKIISMTKKQKIEADELG